MLYLFHKKFFFMKQENIYITWHYTTHGIAFLKNILACFYNGICKIGAEKISAIDIDQDELNQAFNRKKEKGFVFDKVYYLTTQQTAFDRISTRRFFYKKNILNDETINEKSFEIWREVKKLDFIHQENCMELELEYVKQKYPDSFETFQNQIWREMQHYSVKSQINWFLNTSNASEIYKNKFEEVNLNITDLRDIEKIAKNLNDFILRIKKKHRNANFIINTSLGSNETQSTWLILSELNFLPENTRLLKTYDNKNITTHKRFCPIYIDELPTRIFSKVSEQIRIYTEPKTPARKLVDLQMQNFLKLGFAILLIGERGTGKSELAMQFKENKNFVSANCASFDTDSKAESELFGYEKGAFTGANGRSIGLIEAANNGILFLDEIHSLNKLVQSKLMKAFQTDNDNYMSIRRLGANKEIKVTCTLIFATNKKIEDLRDCLLPDFYDRITQLIIEIPPLRETKSDLKNDWVSVWKKMKFEEDCPDSEELTDWLKTLNLYGNWRDLQKIAINYHAYNTFSKEIKNMLNEKSAFEYSKMMFNKYYSVKDMSENEEFSKEQTPKQLISDYQKKLAEWMLLTFKSAKKAKEFYKKTFDYHITEKTIYSWNKGS